jgi:glycosyltransferase involved in cell wall biosynthesis
MTKDPSRADRFVYLTEVDISVDNGPGINEREFVSALLRRHGDEVVCILPEPERPDVFRDNRIRYVRAHHSSPATYLSYLRDSKRAVHELLTEGPLAALVFRPGATPLLPYSLSYSTRTPILLKKLALHAIFGDEVTRSPIKNAVSQSLLPMYRSVIQNALAADVESFTYIDWLHERFGIERRRMRVIPNGVNTRVFKPEAGENRRNGRDLDRFDTVIGYVGALSRIRRVGTLLRAFAGLEDAERTGLVLIGGGADEDSLRAEARELGIGPRVRFVGSVDYSQVPGWMRCFDVAVDPTAVRMRTREGVRTASYSQKIGQYLASGLPVLAWRCRDTEFLVEEGVGRTAPYPDARALASALQDLIRMARGREDDVRGRAREVAERRFDSQALADRRVAWWREIVDDHREDLK